jgi:TetR/AcrR family transcriptional repressor of lmrAB and yxaGH operons
MGEDKKTRRRLVGAAARLFQRQGYSGTGLRQILEESGAPRGSLYFHFPGGKEQLATEAARTAGGRMGAAIDAILGSQADPAQAIQAFARMSGELLRASDYADGCPIATITLEAAHTSETIRSACVASYDEWQGKLRDYLVAHAIEPERAEALALLALAAVEGGLILSRARRSAAPLEQIADIVAQLVAEARAAPRDIKARGKRTRAKSSLK